MGTITYYWKNKTSTQTHGLTEVYPTIKPKMVLIIGHGIGERNPGLTQADLDESFKWSGWANIKAVADTYGIIQIYINTNNNYENGEYQFAVSWAKKKYSALGINNKIWVLGHSLGSYGMGKYAMRDSTFPPQIAGWIMSASGDFTSSGGVHGADSNTHLVWEAIVNNGLKVWGVTAQNDTCSGTTPLVITDMYSAVKALSSSAHVLKTVYPNTEWTCAASHNNVLGRITTSPKPYYSGGNIKLITTGQITSGSPNISMDIYQWMIANPRTSVYKDPTLVYNSSTMPEYPVDQPTNIEIKDFNMDPRVPAILITYKDSSTQLIKPASGDSITNVYVRKNLSNQLIITITFATAQALTKGPYK